MAETERNGLAGISKSLSKDLNKKPNSAGFRTAAPLALMPIDNREHHAALEHLRLQIRGMIFPFDRVANLKRGSLPSFSAASSAAIAPLIASYIMVRLSLVNAA